jgi:hypothetical protein
LEWALEDGEVKPIWATQRMKDCMTYQQSLYKEGLIYKEALTDDSVKEKRDAGIIGVYYHMPMSALPSTILLKSKMASGLRCPGSELTA